MQKEISKRTHDLLDITSFDLSNIVSVSNPKLEESI